MAAAPGLPRPVGLRHALPLGLGGGGGEALFCMRELLPGSRACCTWLGHDLRGELGGFVLGGHGGGLGSQSPLLGSTDRLPQLQEFKGGA